MSGADNFENGNFGRDISIIRNNTEVGFSLCNVSVTMERLRRQFSFVTH